MLFTGMQNRHRRFGRYGWRWPCSLPIKRPPQPVEQRPARVARVDRGIDWMIDLIVRPLRVGIERFKLDTMPAW